MKETKQNLHCLRYLRSLAIGISIFFSCTIHSVKTPENQFKVLERYFTVSHKFQVSKNIRAIVVLSERGCPGCNITFANFLSQQIRNPKLLFVIPATGNSIDISNFIKTKSENIFFDPKDEISELFNLNGSGYISVLDQRVDTIIQLDAFNLASKLDYLTHLVN